MLARVQPPRRQAGTGAGTGDCLVGGPAQPPHRQASAGTVIGKTVHQEAVQQGIQPNPNTDKLAQVQVQGRLITWGSHHHTDKLAQVQVQGKLFTRGSNLNTDKLAQVQVQGRLFASGSSLHTYKLAQVQIQGRLFATRGSNLNTDKLAKVGLLAMSPPTSTQTSLHRYMGDCLPGGPNSTQTSQHKYSYRGGCIPEGSRSNLQTEKLTLVQVQGRLFYNQVQPKHEQASVQVQGRLLTRLSNLHTDKLVQVRHWRRQGFQPPHSSSNYYRYRYMGGCLTGGPTTTLISYHKYSYRGGCIPGGPCPTSTQKSQHRYRRLYTCGFPASTQTSWPF